MQTKVIDLKVSHFTNAVKLGVDEVIKYRKANQKDFTFKYALHVSLSSLL